MKIAVLLSGGVDSSVALRLLQEQGHQLTAFYLKIWLEDELAYLGNCPWEEDLFYAQAVCQQAGLPLEVVPMQREYFESVVAYTIAEVRAGRTPNPDIMCNNFIKFGLFFDKIEQHFGKVFDKVASGHYARNYTAGGEHYLKTAPDPVKDQTYFLARLSQEQIARTLFPLGDYSKKQVRELAEKYDLPNKNRKDSQGICFLGKFKYADFLKHYLGEKEGELLEYETGKKLGFHHGSHFYTIGQRKGLNLPDGPWFVVSKDSEKNQVFISRTYHDTDKKRDNFLITTCNWFSGKPPLDSPNLTVKIRHGSQKHSCVLLKNGTKDNFTVHLQDNDQGIAPGQFAVFYENELCLGSGVIV